MKRTAIAKNTNGNQFGYQEFLPENYDNTKSYPVVFYFHGLGERGDGSLAALERILVNDLPNKLSRGINPFPEDCIVLCPQDLNYAICTPGQINAIYSHCIKVYNGVGKPKCDTNRFYVTGISAGGVGAWTAGTYVTNRTAAIIPICGAGCDIPQAANLKYTPVFAFHAKDDPKINYNVSKNMCDAIAAAGSTVCSLTTYDTGGHGIWWRAYNEINWYHVFEQRLDKNIPKPLPIRVQVESNYIKVIETLAKGPIGSMGDSVIVPSPGDRILVPIVASKAGRYSIGVSVRTGWKNVNSDVPFGMATSYEIYVNNDLRIAVVRVETLQYKSSYGGAYFAELLVQADLNVGINNIEIKTLGAWGGVDYVEALQL